MGTSGRLGRPGCSLSSTEADVGFLPVSARDGSVDCEETLAGVAGSVGLGLDIVCEPPFADAERLLEDDGVEASSPTIRLLSADCVGFKVFASSTSPSSTSVFATSFGVEAPFEL
jgi:hypothetical protein